MTEPSASRPSAARPVRGPAQRQAAADLDRWADLDRRPLAEHVAVFDAEHTRLQQELSRIDQL